MPPIDWIKLLNWLGQGAVNFGFVVVAGYLGAKWAYNHQRRLDAERWKREQERIDAQFEREKERREAERQQEHEEANLREYRQRSREDKRKLEDDLRR